MGRDQASARSSNSSAGEGPKVLDRVRRASRTRNLSIRTDTAYPGWVRRDVRFHNLSHPADLNEKQVRDFLIHLAVERNVAASTQNQALAALLFLYEYVLERPMADLGKVVRAQRPKRLTVRRRNRK